MTHNEVGEALTANTCNLSYMRLYAVGVRNTKELYLSVVRSECLNSLGNCGANLSLSERLNIRIQLVQVGPACFRDEV